MPPTFYNTFANRLDNRSMNREHCNFAGEISRAAYCMKTLTS